MKRRLVSILFCFLLCSCSAWNRYQDVSNKQAAVASEIVEKASEDVKANEDSIKANEPDLALKFDGAALQLLGQPQTPIDIGKLSTPSEQDAFFKKLSHENSSLVTQNSELLEQKANLEKQVEAEAKANETEKWKSFLWKSIFSVVGVIGIGGTIALCVFFPPLLPVLAEAAGTLCGAIYNGVKAIVCFFINLIPKT